MSSIFAFYLPQAQNTTFLNSHSMFSPLWRCGTFQRTSCWGQIDPLWVKGIKKWKEQRSPYNQQDHGFYKQPIPCCTITDLDCTVVLVRSFKIESISQQSSDSLSQAVFVGFLSSLIQQNVRDQTRVSAAFHILISQSKKKKGHHLDSFPQITVGLIYKYLYAIFVGQC